MQSRFITIYFWNRRKDPEIAEIFVIQEVNDGKQSTYKYIGGNRNGNCPKTTVSRKA